MKFVLGISLVVVGRSPPSRGAWIEIAVLYYYCEFCNVAPLAGGVD